MSFVAYRTMAEQQHASALYDSRIIKFMDFALSEAQPVSNVYTGKRAGGNGSLWSVAWDDGPIVTPTAESMGPRFVHRVYRIWFRPSTAAHKSATGIRGRVIRVLFWGRLRHSDYLIVGHRANRIQ